METILRRKVHNAFRKLRHKNFVCMVNVKNVKKVNDMVNDLVKRGKEVKGLLFWFEDDDETIYYHTVDAFGSLNRVGIYQAICDTWYDEGIDINDIQLSYYYPDEN